MVLNLYLYVLGFTVYLCMRRGGVESELILLGRIGSSENLWGTNLSLIGSRRTREAIFLGTEVQGTVAVEHWGLPTEYR
jgi:hypothetical protein